MRAVPIECQRWRHRELSGLFWNLQEDIHRYLNRYPEDQVRGDSLKRRVSALLTPEILCLLLYRVAHLLSARGWGRVAGCVSRANFFLHKVNITPQSCIGPGCRLSHPAGVTFQGSAGRDLTLFSLAVCCPQISEECRTKEYGAQLKDRVLIGAHAVLLGPITVGSDTKIAYSVRLDRDSPPGFLVICKSLRPGQRPLFASNRAKSRDGELAAGLPVTAVHASETPARS